MMILNEKAPSKADKTPFLKYPQRSHKGIVLSTILSGSPSKKPLEDPQYTQNRASGQFLRPKLFSDEELDQGNEGMQYRADNSMIDVRYESNQYQTDLHGEAFANDMGYETAYNEMNHSVNRSTYDQTDTQRLKNSSLSPSKSPLKKKSSPVKGFTFKSTKKVEPPLYSKLKEKSSNPKEAQILAYKDLVDNEIKNLHSVSYEELAQVVYNKELFMHVCRTPEFIMANARSLGRYLNAPCRSELEKAWVLFLWVAQNLSVNPDALLEDNEGSLEGPTGILSHPTSLAQGYTMVFKNIAQEMGLKVRVIEGYCKGYTYCTGSRFDRENHQWNAVDIGGRWHLVDTMMGSGHLDTSYGYVRELDLYYFFTIPEKLLMTHFPSYEYWQLVDKPIAKEAYENAAHVYPKYFDYCLELLTHKTSVVEINAEQNVFSLRTLTNVHLVAELCKDNVSRRCDSCVFPRYQGNGVYDFDVLFPTTGTYYLRVFGADTHTRLQTQHLLISYKLSVKYKTGPKSNKSAGLMRKYPRVDPKFFHEYEVEMLSHPYGILFHQTQQQPLTFAFSCLENIILSGILCRGEDHSIAEEQVSVEADKGFFEFQYPVPEQRQLLLLYIRKRNRQQRDRLCLGVPHCSGV